MKQIELTSPQMALILALDPIFGASEKLRLVCIHCAAMHDHELQTANHPTDDVWQMHCRCTERTFHRQNLAHTMRPSGDLLAMADEMLKGTGLAVRCPNRPSQCLTTPLRITTESNGDLTARCQCWQFEVGAGIYRFRKQQMAVA